MERQLSEGTNVMDNIRRTVSRLVSIRLHEKPKVTVDWLILVRDAKTGKLLKTIRKRNLLVDGGLGLFALAMKQPFIAYNTTRYYWYLVLGTGAGVPDHTDTGLFTPVAASAKHGTISQTGPQYQYYVRYLPEDANGYTYTECGIYDKVGYHDTGIPNTYDTGTLLNHLMLSPTLTKDATILVDFYITITFS